MCAQTRTGEDEEDDGKVAYLPLLQRLGVTIRPGDLEGVSTQIYDDHNVRELRHRAGQNYRWVLTRASLIYSSTLL